MKLSSISVLAALACIGTVFCIGQSNSFPPIGVNPSATGFTVITSGSGGAPQTLALTDVNNPTMNFYLRNSAGVLQCVNSTFSAITCNIDQAGNMTLPAIKATTGTRFVCVTTGGTLVSQATACSGT